MERKKKSPTVDLVIPRTGARKAFEVSHAERILDMGAALNGGWVLPDNSKYIYDEENGLRVKSDKANSAKAD